MCFLSPRTHPSKTATLTVSVTAENRHACAHKFSPREEQMTIKSFYHLDLMVDRFREMLPMQPQLDYFPSFISKNAS